MKKITFIISIIVLFLCLVTPSCANRGQGPQGGPKDTIPPVVLNEMPANGSLNSKVKEIEVTFDELILTENTMENVIISPPQTKLPEIKSRGKKLVVVFNEDLIDSTTYTIDFGNSIVDNNEKNPLRGYTYAFSTGPTIDSLQISGYLINAEDLNPVEGCLVGLHADLSDTAFTSKPFTRVTRTDSVGYFTIKNIKEGRYKIFALNDLSRDYMFQAGEGLAFNDSIITPYVKTEVVVDTIFNDSLFVDSIVHKNNVLYGPDNILLYYFKENKVMRRLLKTERPEQHFFRIYFSAPADSLPHIEPIGEDWSKQQSADILRDLANNPNGGEAGAIGAGLGLGMAAGGAFGGMAQQMFGGAPAAGGQTKAAADDPVEALSKLKKMLDADLITQSEYDAKKAEILRRM